ncbi:hypothetical protein QR680_013072 [Steinernema hermaphroditum]|uniref:Uncharacterized protein n=1 Tax=Steinernema hermaphroditum TaxID=289476 RepID=A0AA39M1W0_9BILA|nr:hypothetical protein QR680_013072 [Steinernema hermaphroditum]
MSSTFPPKNTAREEKCTSPRILEGAKDGVIPQKSQFVIDSGNNFAEYGARRSREDGWPWKTSIRLMRLRWGMSEDRKGNVSTVEIRLGNDGNVAEKINDGEMLGILGQRDALTWKH